MYILYNYSNAILEGEFITLGLQYYLFYLAYSITFIIVKRDYLGAWFHPYGSSLFFEYRSF